MRKEKEELPSRSGKTRQPVNPGAAILLPVTCAMGGQWYKIRCCMVCYMGLL